MDEPGDPGIQIDWEALVKGVRVNCMFDCPVSVVTARAVVAALRDQGLVVARAEDVAWLLSREQGNLRLATRDSSREQRVRAALAAPGDGGKEGDGGRTGG